MFLLRTAPPVGRSSFFSMEKVGGVFAARVIVIYRNLVGAQPLLES
jgi:hypothetical protein